MLTTSAFSNDCGLGVPLKRARRSQKELSRWPQAKPQRPRPTDLSAPVTSDRRLPQKTTTTEAAMSSQPTGCSCEPMDATGKRGLSGHAARSPGGADHTAAHCDALRLPHRFGLGPSPLSLGTKGSGWALVLAQPLDVV